MALLITRVTKYLHKDALLELEYQLPGLAPRHPLAALCIGVAITSVRIGKKLLGIQW